MGTARVGLALSGEDSSMVLPHDTVPAADAVGAILDLVDELDAGVVVGWPLELTGREGRATRRVEVFLEQLAAEAVRRGTELVVERRDERLTTGLAEALLDEAGVYGRKRKGVVDQVAAVQILQNFIEERDGANED